MTAGLSNHSCLLSGLRSNACFKRAISDVMCRFFDSISSGGSPFGLGVGAKRSSRHSKPGESLAGKKDLLSSERGESSGMAEDEREMLGERMAGVLLRLETNSLDSLVVRISAIHASLLLALGE